LDLRGFAPARTGHANSSCFVRFVLADVDLATIFLEAAVEDSANLFCGDCPDASLLHKAIPF
jgi:hypothetical protein